MKNELSCFDQMQTVNQKNATSIEPLFRDLFGLNVVLTSKVNLAHVCVDTTFQPPLGLK
jgi:hypothetical protein